MNAKRLMYKLQTALCAKGVRVKINQRQHWSDYAGKMVTRYVVQDDCGGKPIIETYKAHEVVIALAEMLNGGDAE